MYNLNLLVKLMVLHHQILFSLTIAAIAEAILMWIFAEQVPSMHRVAPRYLKLVTSSNFSTTFPLSCLKNEGKATTTVLTVICQKIWETKDWPRNGHNCSSYLHQRKATSSKVRTIP